MSSHHIVREKQEPALLILDLNNFDDEHLGQLLEWSPTVIATARTAEQVNAFGIKVDVIIGSATDEPAQSDIKYVDGGNHIIDAAFAYLIKNGYAAVNVVLDSINLDKFAPYISSINVVLYSSYMKFFPVQSGFSKWKAAGENVALFHNGNNVKTTGLQLVNPNRYKTIADGFYTLSFSAPFLFVREDI